MSSQKNSNSYRGGRGRARARSFQHGNNEQRPGGHYSQGQGQYNQGQGQYNQGQSQHYGNYSQGPNQGSSVAGQYDNTDGTQPGSVSTRPFEVQSQTQSGQNRDMRPPGLMNTTGMGPNPYRYEQQNSMRAPAQVPHPRPMMLGTPPPGIAGISFPPPGYGHSGRPSSDGPGPRAPPPGIALAMGRGVNPECGNAAALDVRMPAVPHGSMLTGFPDNSDGLQGQQIHDQRDNYGSGGGHHGDEWQGQYADSYPGNNDGNHGYSDDNVNHPGNNDSHISETPTSDQQFKVPSTPDSSEVQRSESHGESRSRSSERCSPAGNHRSRSRDSAGDTPEGRPQSGERSRGRSGDMGGSVDANNRRDLSGDRNRGPPRDGSRERNFNRQYNHRDGSRERNFNDSNQRRDGSRDRADYRGPYRSPARGRGGFNLPRGEPSHWSSPGGSSQGSPVKPMWSPQSMSSPEYGGRSDRQWSSYSSSDGSSPYKGRRRDDPTVYLSKTLASILRHNAQNFGFTLMKGGYLYVEDILQGMQKLRGYTVDDVIGVVESNDKKRFTLERDVDTGRLKIRANQGHSIQVEDLDLKPVTSADEVPKVIHGTYYESWDKIKHTGLCRMNRNHIHFAVGEPGDNEVISGMRSTCQVLIFIDMEKALKGGLKFYRSANNVILCPGNDDGVIPPCYFLGVTDRINRYKLDYDATITGEKLSETDKADMRSKKRKKKGSRGKEHDEDDWRGHHDPSLPEPKRHTSGSEQVKGAAIQEGKTENGATRQAEKLEGVVQQNRKTEEDWRDLTMVTDVQQSRCVVDNILTNMAASAVSVVCCGDNLGLWDSAICLMLVLARPHVYVYQFGTERDRTLMKEGQLEKLLMSSKVHKVFDNIKDVSSALVTQFDILLDGVPIWDVSMMFSKFEGSRSDTQKEELKALNVTGKLFKQWREKSRAYGRKLSSADSVDNAIVKELAEQGKTMLSIYDICSNTSDSIAMKTLKKEMFEAVLPKYKDSFLAQKIAQLKLEKKKDKQVQKPKAEGGDSGKSEKIPNPPKKSQKKGKKK